MRVALRAALLALLALAASVAKSQTPFSVEQLMQTLAGTTSLNAAFQEQKYLAALDQPLRLTGILRYRAPGYLSKRTLLPYRELFEVDGERLLSETPDHGRRELRLDDRPELAALVASLRGTLAGDLNRLRRYYALELSGQRDAWTLTLTPTDAGVRRFIVAVTISGNDGRVNRIEVLEAGGDRSLLTVQHG